MKYLPPPAPPRWKQDLLSIGVTGTNGKTTTTTLVAHVLSTIAKPVARATTLGAYLGDEEADVPRNHAGFIELMRRCLDRGGRFASVEMTSESLALGFAGGWPCEIAIFTNLTHDHQDSHGSFEHYLASKAQLFMKIPRGGTAVLNGSDENSALIEEVIPKGVRVWRYGVAERGNPEGADLIATDVQITREGTSCSLHSARILGDIPKKLSVQGIGAVFIENAMAALLGTLAAGVPAEDAVRALASAPIPAGRFEFVGEKPLVAVDFAHTPDALVRTLTAARALTPKGATLWVVFGAGGNRDTKKRAPMGAAAMLADKIVLTSDNPRSESPQIIADQIASGIEAHAQSKIVRQLDRRRAIDETIAAAEKGDVIVLAGRGHERVQTIGTTAVEFSDADVAREALRRR